VAKIEELKKSPFMGPRESRVSSVLEAVSRARAAPLSARYELKLLTAAGLAVIAVRLNNRCKC